MCMLGVAGVDTARAATNEPDANGVYRYLELAKQNDFRVYAVPGETIHVTVYPGVGVSTNFPNEALCNTIQILERNGAAVAGSGRISGIRSDGTTFGVSQGGAEVSRSPAQTSTCSTSGATDNRPFRQITLSYTVPAGHSITSMEGAYIIRFAKDTDPGDRVQGYEWRIAVSDDANYINDSARPASASKPGRVWFVGDNTGLTVWQRNSQRALSTNSTNHMFRFVRKDGYRYSVWYDDYHGIWSTFHGGVYGARINGGANDDKPAYTSYYEKSTAFKYTVTPNPAGFYNLAYIFVDCPRSGSECPTQIPFLRNQPITRDPSSSPTTNSTGTFTSNPIADKDESPAATKGFRYTGYTATNLTGGTVTIPYTAMQTGYINLTVKVNGATVCQKQFIVDEPEGSGVKTWMFTSTAVGSSDGLGSCDSGTWRSPASRPSPFTVSSSSRIEITAQATHLGEMHFIDVDTEKRGGIEVKGNGLGSAAEQSSIIWYDPFSRLEVDTCGLIPSRVGAGLVAPNANGSNTSGGDNNTTIASNPALWLSMSNLTGSGVGRLAFNSAVSGGVHGWTSEDTWESRASDRDACDGYGSDSTAGHANADGTATDESTWGNNRVVEDWTYEFQLPPSRTIYLGGPGFELTPSATATPAKLVPNQSTTFTYNVSNSGSATSGTAWTIRSVVILPGAALPADYRNGFDGAGRTCASYYRNPAPALITCNDSAASGTGSFPGTTIPSENVPQSYPVGTRICRSLTVNPYSSSNPVARTSALTCAIVAAAPYISVIGGNVWAGGSIDAATGYYGANVAINGSSSGNFGSFGEYGVFATGTVDYFGSAGKIGLARTASGGIDGARLTFGSAVSLGNFTNAHKISNLISYYEGASHAATVLSGSTVSGSGVYVYSGVGTLNVSAIAPNANPSAVIYAPNGTVLINGDLIYNYPAASSFKDLPSLTVIANTIVITGNVTQLSGNFYASGKFVTCNEGPWSTGENASKSSAITTTGACSKQLVINGTVTVANQAAGSLVLNRSYGGTTTGQPAEMVRMRPESFLTPYEQNLIFTTIQETELPARY